MPAQRAGDRRPFALFHLVIAQEQIDRVLPESVVEVVLIVPRERVGPVPQKSLLRPLARPREISFKRAGARVLDGNQVGVVRPNVLEQLDHPAADSLQRLPAVQNSQLRQRQLQRALRQHALNDVGAVQAVDAIRPEHAVLRRRERSRSEMEHAEFVLLVRQPVDENVEPVPAHLLALRVEVESLVALVGTPSAAHHLRHRLLQLIFRAAMVDQIHQHHLAVVHHQAVHVDLIRRQMVARDVDPRPRLQLQVRRLIPEDRNASADLHERHLLPVVLDDLLGLDEVRDVAVVVDSAAEESRAGAFR